MAHGTAQQVSDKWLRGIQNAGQDITDGVNRVTVAPGQAAASKRQKWINALQDPATQDKWARNVAAVSLSAWKSAMTEYGIGRVAAGAQAKQPKFTTAMNSLLPFIDQVRDQVRAMPDDTPAAREQRALAMMRGMRNYQRPAA